MMRAAILIAALTALTAHVHAQKAGTCSGGYARAYLDVNNVRASVFNNGALFFPEYGCWPGPFPSYEIPKSSGRQAMFATGIIIAGMSDGELRMASAYFGPEFWPGPLDDKGRPPASQDRLDRIYKISRADILNYDKTGEASKDLQEWPIGLGAPVIDGDGIQSNYLLRHGDRPAMIGDQMLWWVMNGLTDEEWTGGSDVGLTKPVAVEVRGAAFAFNEAPNAVHTTALGRTHAQQLTNVLLHTTFYRYEIHYRGSTTLENARFGLFVEPDLGNGTDDFIGSDPERGLAFVYNGDDLDEGVMGYGERPPALGIDIFKGPVLEPDGADNDGDGLIDEAGERGGMASFIMPNSDSSVMGNPRGGADLYTYLQALWRDGTPLTVGGNGYGGSVRTTFQYSGNPPGFWSEEDVDGNGARNTPADRHFFLSAGPFTMDPGDIEVIYFGIIWSRGRDRLDSVYRLKADDDLIQQFFEELIRPYAPRPIPTRLTLSRNFPNPFRDHTTIAYELPGQTRVAIVVYDVLGREVATLVDAIQPPGMYEVEFDAGNLPPGIYFYELQAGLVRGAHTMVLAR